jgi:hypothetical protein
VVILTRGPVSSRSSRYTYQGDSPPCRRSACKTLELAGLLERVKIEENRQGLSIGCGDRRGVSPAYLSKLNDTPPVRLTVPLLISRFEIVWPRVL